MKDLEAKILIHLQRRGWDNLRPSDLAKSIMIEGAELLENFQWDNPSLTEVKTDKEKLEAVKKELADVLIYAIEMSVLLNLDTEKIIRSKLAKAAKKYPVKLFNGKKKKKDEPGTEKLYWEIKKQHRRKGL